MFSILLVILAAIPSAATMDTGDLYEEAKAHIVWGEYEEALQKFQQLSEIPGDTPARRAEITSWIKYCSGMIALHTATELENQGYIKEARQQVETARSFFMYLTSSDSDFNGNSKKLYAYCEARLYELDRLNYTALNAFAKILEVEDSYERFTRLSKGDALPTQVPVNEIPSVLPPIAAHLNIQVNAYYGPGTSYAAVPNTILINAETKLDIRGREQSYYMIEIQTNSGKMRCWVNNYRVMRDEDTKVPSVGKKAKSRRMIRTETPSYGPGDDYAKADFTIAKGVVVSAFEEEGLYTLIEYTPTGAEKPVRVWVFTHALSK